jgi:hypothetical protein
VWYAAGVPIAGERPERGVRIVIERDASRSEAPRRYAGAAHLPDASFPIAVVVDAAGAVTVTVTGADGAPGHASQGELANQVRLIARTAYRQAASDGEAPPWRIQRWRGEK